MNKLMIIGLLTMAVFSSWQAQAKDKFNEPPAKVYDNIPANWNYYFLEPELIEAYSGDVKEKICFHEDFKSPSKFEAEHISSGRRASSNERSIRDVTQDYRLMLGGTDFIVISEDKLIVKTEHTGSHILNVKYCKRELRRAKYLKFFDEIEAMPSAHCYSSKLKDGLMFFTRRNSGNARCKIESIREWTGPFDLDGLSRKNKASYAENKIPNNIDTHLED